MKTLLFFTIIGSLLLMGFSALFSPAATEIAVISKASAVAPVEPEFIAEKIRPTAAQPLKEENMFDRADTVRSEIESSPESSDTTNNRQPGQPIFTFNGSEPTWYTVNDSVMGGISSSNVRVDEISQKLIFSGKVSLENNGGFASTRSDWTGYDLRDYDGVLMRVRGDGNDYRLRTRTERTGTDVAYTAIFETEIDTWQEIYIPFADMIPTYRGFVVNAAGPLDPSTVRSFGLMVADKQQGQFFLEVDWINAVAVKRNESTFASIAGERVQAPSLVYADS